MFPKAMAETQWYFEGRQLDFKNLGFHLARMPVSPISLSHNFRNSLQWENSPTKRLLWALSIYHIHGGVEGDPYVCFHPS